MAAVASMQPMHASAGMDQQHSILAIRNCASFTSSAIFYRWEDGKQFLVDASDQYRLCASLMDAMDYIQFTTPSAAEEYTVSPIDVAPSHPLRMQAASPVAQTGGGCFCAIKPATNDTQTSDNNTGKEPSTYNRGCGCQCGCGCGCSGGSYSSQSLHHLIEDPVILTDESVTSSCDERAHKKHRPEGGCCGGGKKSATKPKRGPKPFKGKSFEEMFAELEEYKRINGHVNVPSLPKTPLLNWTKALRKDYEKDFKRGRATYLTEERIQRLTMLGFNFHLRNLTAFEESAMNWLEYKTKHRQDPPSSSALGSWVRYTRKAHKNVMQKKLDPKPPKRTGRPANLTPEWIARLTSWGFVWQTNEQRRRQSVPKRPWDDRLEQLLDYQKTHGHMLVPQKYPVLGTWVHSQRSEYKKFKDGKKARINQERIDKLIDAGFVFDTRTHKNADAASISAPPVELLSNQQVIFDVSAIRNELVTSGCCSRNNRFREDHDPLQHQQTFSDAPVARAGHPAVASAPSNPAPPNPDLQEEIQQLPPFAPWEKYDADGEQ